MLILDASAAVDLVVTSSRTPALRRLTGDQRLFAPQLMYTESLAAVRRLEQADKITSTDADAAVARIMALPVRTVWSADWLAGAWARRSWLRISDAIYLSASERLGAPILTTDQRLGRALADRSIDVITV